MEKFGRKSSKMYFRHTRAPAAAKCSVALATFDGLRVCGLTHF